MMNSITPRADAEFDVMGEDELENIRRSMRNKSITKPRKRRNNNNGRGNGSLGGSNRLASTSPPSSEGCSKPGSDVFVAGGSEVVSNGVDPAAPGDETIVPLQVEGQALCEGPIREEIEEIRTEYADSDDEIPLPKQVPAFQSLEEAMMVRELRKDRLPGRVIRGSAVSGNLVSEQ